MGNDNKIIIYTDGSSLGNPGPGGWGVIIYKEERVFELGGREKQTTNNRMEMTAIIEALSFLKKTSKKIILYTDSSYVINGATKWVNDWQNNKWLTKNKNEVLNRDLWEKIIKLKNKLEIKWEHVPGHVGILGNEQVDKIASSFADNQKIILYQGLYSKYGINLLDLNINKIKNKTKSRSKQKAYSYLSLIDGRLKKHQDWASCEKRVKGQNAKFKKAISLEDEKKILKDWGVKL